MQHLSPSHFANTANDRLTWDEWFATYNAARASFGLKPVSSGSVELNDHYTLGEDPMRVARWDRDDRDEPRGVDPNF